MFGVRRIHGEMSTDTMDARCQLIHKKKITPKYLATKKFFVEAYPIKKKSDCHLGLDRFVEDYGAPNLSNPR